MDASGWVSVLREDGETVGYLEPLDPGFERFQPRNLLGHAVGAGCSYVDGEERLIERGISELIELWTLDGQYDDREAALAILEASPRGIILANAQRAKAMAPAERIRVEWPDVAQRLALLR